MSAHTAGPWLIAECLGARDIQVTTQKRINDELSDICEMDIHFDGEVGEEQRANACLIAAAPDGLAFAQHFIEAMRPLNARHVKLQDELEREARAFIAKATQSHDAPAPPSP